MFKNFKKILQQKNILKTLVIRNLKARYEGSFLGMLWTVITPLIITAVISFVFTRVLKVGIPGFALFVLSAFLPWMFFSRTLNESANSIIVNSSLLNQFHFPKELIPLSVVISNIISFLAGFIVILPIFFVFNPAIGKYIWILPFNILFFSFFVLGMCFFLSAVTVYVRDINHLLETLLLFWFWITPVFYALDMIPADYKIICWLNPVSSFMIIFRSILYKGEFPGAIFIISSFVSSLTALYLGYLFFNKVSSKFFKRL